MLMKLWFSTATDSRFVIVRARPATRPIEASVTRNDGSRTSVTKRPLTAPTPTPTPSPAATASTALWLRIASAVTSALNATTEPSERSISPALRTKTVAQVCTGAGLTLIGPSVGQIATVIGPTIISPSVVIGASVVSAGNVVVGP
jgi:hypothetical protein